MQTTANKYGTQMKLAGSVEWVRAGSDWHGTDVLSAPGHASVEWLSDCEKERSSSEDLMTKIASVSNLAQACRRVISNGGKGGVDRMEVKELSSWFNSNWRNLQSELLSGSYEPSAVLGVKIPKPSGGQRQLGIPTVKDRLVQQAIHQELSPRYERVFSNTSYGFRPQRSAHEALSQAGQYVSKGKNWVVDLDIAKFFDEVNHDRLLWLLSRRIGDKRLLKLISRFLKSGMMQDGLLSQRVKGTPQGGPLSPLLSNIVLDELDKELERRCHSFVRYADDVIILVKSQRAAHRVMHSISRYLSDRLRLRVSEAKTRICRPHELNFLGHAIGWKGELYLSKESEKRFKQTIGQITKRTRSLSLAQLISELNAKVRGWLYYFRYARMKKKLRYLISWLHRKLRCYRLKQCKRAIGMMRFLHRQGVPKNRAWTTAASRKGWWRNANTPAANEAMNNKWFLKQGLIDFNKLYINLHTLRETAVYESTHGGVRGRGGRIYKK